MKKKRLCFITGTRAEYGLLSLLMNEIEKNIFFELQIIATGTHLSKKYGNTINEIKKDGFKINKKIDIKLASDTPKSISNSIGLCIKNISSALLELKPDLVIILGDRFEMLSAAIASIIVGIPIAHIHGGEITEGAIDDSMRHCITKLSSIHLAASDEYKKRIIQMGENPKNVYNVGGLGVDNIKKTKLLNKEKLETLLGCKFYKKNLLITFHPETIDRKLSLKHMRQLLKALENFNSTRLIFTMPNADMGSKAIFNLIKIFARNNPNVFVCKSMGRLAYLSCISHVDAVVGNSSSGILEVPALKKPTINIGNRQKGRAQPLSVISVKPIVKSIISAISMSYEKKYQTKQYYKNNPYGNGGAIKKIVNILEKIDYRNLSKKTFYDLPGWIN